MLQTLPLNVTLMLSMNIFIGRWPFHDIPVVVPTHACSPQNQLYFDKYLLLHPLVS